MIDREKAKERDVVITDLIYSILTERRHRDKVRAPNKEKILTEVQYFMRINLDVKKE